MKRSRSALAILVTLGLGAGAALSALQPGRASLIVAAPPRTQNAKASLTFPYNRPTSVRADSEIVRAAWLSWKAAHITSSNTGKPDRMRVIGDPKDGSTFSEGMGYGLVFASLIDEQATFDALWRFEADHLDPHGLMHWKIGNPQEYRGTGAATDGDVDTGIGLVQACVKTRSGVWPKSTLDYCALASTLITAIYDFEVDKPGALPKGAPTDNKGGELLPGDSWNTTNKSTVNLSYFAPAYFRVFGEFTGHLAEWNAVVARNYELIKATQALPGNCSKLVPNWNAYDGTVRTVDWQPQNSGWWSWDAARTGWRIALDRSWSASRESIETSNEIGSFFASVGVDNVKAEYGLDGTAKNTYTSPFFVSNAAGPIWAATKLNPVKCGSAGGSVVSTPQQAYDKNIALTDQPDSYYGNAWRLLSMLLMSGNFPNLYAESTGGTTLAFTDANVPKTNVAKPKPVAKARTKGREQTSSS